MKLIPNYINETSPSGEKRVFYLFKDLNQDKYKDWVVYHSLNYPVTVTKKDRNSYKYFGETDFLLFIPNKGLINIEIKGGRIFTKDGVWFTENRFGVSRLKKSPFVQATDSMKNIQRYLSSIDINLPQTFLVVFPDCDFHQDSIEWSEDNLCSGELDQLLIKKICTLEKNYLIQSSEKFFPDNNTQNKLKKIIRSNFESFQSFHSLLSQSTYEINKFTEGQIDILDQIETNRMLITGSQGTGKTTVAIEIAKRKISEGYKVLFLNSNRLACENIRYDLRKVIDYNEHQISIQTYAGFISGRASSVFSQSDKSDEDYSLALQSDFYEKNNILTNYYLNKILESKSFTQYDCIILDEVQNYYYYDNFYNLMDCLLKEGLKNGSWYLFGDFEFQKLFTLHKNVEDLEVKDPVNNLKNYQGYTTQLLIDNVRNATDICVQAPIISNVSDKLPYRIGNKSGEIMHYFAENKRQKVKILENTIEKLHKNQIKGNDITVLSPFRLENEENLLKHCDISKYYKLINLNKVNFFGQEIIQNKNNENYLYFSTIQYFQGMENKIIILTDPMTTSLGDSEIRDHIMKNEKLEKIYPESFLTFNAMGRANSILYIIWDKCFESYVMEKKAKSVSLIK